MSIDNQLTIWDLLSRDIAEADAEVKGAINLKSTPISEFEVSMTTGDLVLIVSMIEDYIRGMDVIRADDIQWSVYYRERFRKISDHIQQGIDYDYEKARHRCLNKQEKESDIGDEAMSLLIKKAMLEADRKKGRSNGK